MSRLRASRAARSCSKKHCLLTLILLSAQRHERSLGQRSREDMMQGFLKSVLSIMMLARLRGPTSAR
jgi:hypothetical protein